jgi:hypothetical protein
VPNIGEYRFYARECARWAEASTNEPIRKALLEVAKVWATHAVNEQATIRPQPTELKSHLSVGLRCSSGRLYMRQKHPNQQKPQEPMVLARHNNAGGKEAVPDELPRPSSERAIAWGLAVSAIVMTAVMIGWGWGVAAGGGWGHSNQLAQMMAPASGPTDGPATRAWTPPSNGRFR